MIKRFKLGDRTKEIWSGDTVSDCEFICYIEKGQMIFYDLKFKCFRLVFPEIYKDANISFEKTYILNGWRCASNISELLKL